MSSQYLKNVAIVGAGGNAGSVVTQALVDGGKHTITAITRLESNSQLPKGIHDIRKADYSDHAALVKAFVGQDVVLIFLAVTAPRDTQAKLVNAAVEAGVKWIMPNTWGGDYTKPEQDALGLGAGAMATNQYIESKGANWIGVANGFWYEFSLSGAELRYGFDMKERTFTMFDDGDVKHTCTTWPQLGRAMAALLILPVEGTSPSVSDWKNKYVHIESFKLSQKDMFESVLRVTGTKESDWKISHEGTKERFERGMQAMKTGDWRGFGMVS